MRGLLECEPLRSSCATLAETSKSQPDKNLEATYMLDSDITVIDFDLATRAYAQELSLEELPCSADALYADDDETLYIVEFKSGRMKGRTTGVQSKCRDSVLILGDILKKPLSWFRDRCIFILVYDESKNSSARSTTLGAAERLDSSELQSSQAFNRLSASIAKLGGTEIVQFGLKRFEGYCFKCVRTLTPDEFCDQYISQWEQQLSAKRAGDEEQTATKAIV